MEFRRLIQHCDGLLIASPEYAHGISGVMKNALDWLVAGTEFIGKPVALFNASARATLAYTALAETITVMSGKLVEDACVTIPLVGEQLNLYAVTANPKLSGSIRGSAPGIGVGNLAAVSCD